jgi:isoleucyl-tRNA synthetase
VEAVKPAALRAIEKIDFKPLQCKWNRLPKGEPLTDIQILLAKRRLESFITGRSEWCISRQRSWGVPIPVLHDAETGEAHLNNETLDHIIPILEQKGTDHWWSESIEEFVPESLKKTGKTFRKGFDTMDVWFDSGASWTILRDQGFKADSEPLADIYLEGSDQHRGWFQSSLLTRLCSAEPHQAFTPYSKVVTHGFVLAQDGSKMSKSSGNGVMPMDVIEGGKVGQK